MAHVSRLMAHGRRLVDHGLWFKAHGSYQEKVTRTDPELGCPTTMLLRLCPMSGERWAMSLGLEPPALSHACCPVIISSWLLHRFTMIHYFPIWMFCARFLWLAPDVFSWETDPTVCNLNTKRRPSMRFQEARTATWLRTAWRFSTVSISDTYLRETMPWKSGV